MPVDQLAPDDVWPVIPTAPGQLPQLPAHDRRWLSSICAGLHHRPTVLVYRAANGEPEGILPLVFVKSLLFGKFLVSLPYVNSGGVWAANDLAAHELVNHACLLADQFDVRYLELRHELPLAHPRLNAQRIDKVHMRLDLPGSTAELERSFKSKLRSQIKKAREHDLSIEWGHAELLSDFYQVFSINMRDLGTPVFSRHLFEAILDRFSSDAELCVVKHNSRPVAAGLLVHNRGQTEVPSASSLRRFNFTSANLWMYSHMLERAITRGSTVFDFGRSSQDSGTYKFKAQWGARPYPAHWQYYVRHGSAEEMRSDAPNKQKLVRLWQKLPVTLTRLFGPGIVRGIP